MSDPDDIEIIRARFIAALKMLPAAARKAQLQLVADELKRKPKPESRKRGRKSRNANFGSVVDDEIVSFSVDYFFQHQNVPRRDSLNHVLTKFVATMRERSADEISPDGYRQRFRKLWPLIGMLSRASIERRSRTLVQQLAKITDTTGRAIGDLTPDEATEILDGILRYPHSDREA